jgi:hypothetical protein
MNRLNFSSSLITKHWVSLYKSSIYVEPVFPDSIIRLGWSGCLVCIDELVDSRLTVVYRTLQHIAILFNQHYYEKTPINASFVQQGFGFVHSSLLDLRNQLWDSLSECLRLGMIAFLTTTFRVPGLKVQHYYSNLADEFQRCYTSAKASHRNLQEYTEIDTWLSMICIMSAVNEDPGTWKTCAATATQALSWSDMRRRLKKVMWIDSFHDDLGEKAFQRFMS